MQAPTGPQEPQQEEHRSERQTSWGSEQLTGAHRRPLERHRNRGWKETPRPGHSQHLCTQHWLWGQVVLG